MTNCQACARKSDLWLCGQCQAKLRAELEALPWWLARLAEAAVGQVKLGDGGRGGTRSEPFAGDDEAMLPEGDRAAMQRRFLAAGRVNARASALVDEIGNVLGVTIRDLCETRGVECPTISSPARMALWLAGSVSALAASEGAGESYSELCGLSGRIVKVINRPERRVWLGECPTWHEPSRRACGLPLFAKEDAIEVRCQRCGAVHPCDRIRLLTWNDLERTKVPWVNILRANKSQPEDRQVPERTLQSWRSSGRLQPRAYRRASTGREVINRHSADDEPLYLWPDVRKLRDAKPQKVATGAAARKRGPAA